MIGKIIDLAARHRWFVILALIAITLAALRRLRRVPLDAIPDLSDPQVIVFTEWKGRSPTLVEDQVTYPISSALLAAPKVTAVRGFSMFGMSFVYVLFEEGTDVYWARSRVNEYLGSLERASARGNEPGARPRRDRYRLGVQLRAGRSRPERTTSPSSARSKTSTCATRSPASPVWPRSRASAATRSSSRSRSIPRRLEPTASGSNDVAEAVRRSNAEVGGRLLEMSGRESFVRGRGYLRTSSEPRAASRSRTGPERRAGARRRRRPGPVRRRDPARSRPSSTGAARPSGPSWWRATARTLGTSSRASRPARRRSRRRSRRA